MEKEKRGNLIVLSLLFLLFRTYVIQKPSFQKSSTCFQFLLRSHTLFFEIRSFCRSFSALNLTQRPLFSKMYKKGTYDVLDTVDFFSLSCANLVFCFLKKMRQVVVQRVLYCAKGENKTLLPPPLLSFPFHARSDSPREECNRIAFRNMHKAKKNSLTVRGKNIYNDILRLF